MNDDLKSMNVMIAGRSYPLRVKSNDQEDIQIIVDELNEKIKDFQLTYINKDKQDCLAMALLTYAVEFRDLKKEQSPSEILSKKVDQLESMIDEILE